MNRVSVVTPCHRAERFLPRLLATVAAQTLTDWQHVVVDDGSPDASAEILSTHLRFEPRLSLVRQPNAGAAAARNRGFRASDPRSEYLLFLDADDELKPAMLERMVGHLDANPDVAMVFCNHDTIDAEGRSIGGPSPSVRYVPTRFGVRRMRNDEEATPFAAFFFWAAVTPSDVLLRRSAFERSGGFSEDLVYTEDLDLWLKIALHGSVHYLDERLVVRRLHGANLSIRTDVRGHERKLFERWIEGEWLTDSERRLVHELWRIRQGRLLPVLWLVWGSEHLRKGQLRPATTAYLRSGKRVAQYAASAMRRRLPAGPVW